MFNIREWIDRFTQANMKKDKAFQVALFLSKHLHWRTPHKKILHPDLAWKVQQIVDEMELGGMPVVVAEGFRPAKKQQDYYDQGRTTGGNIITNAKPFQSYHQYGLAVDIIFRDYGWSPPEGWWDELGKVGKFLGLEWGGDWAVKDRPHFQLPPEYYAHWEDLIEYFDDKGHTQS